MKKSKITKELIRINKNKKDIATLLEREFNILGLFDSKRNAIPIKYWCDVINMHI